VPIRGIGLDNRDEPLNEVGAASDVTRDDDSRRIQDRNRGVDCLPDGDTGLVHSSAGVVGRRTVPPGWTEITNNAPSRRNSVETAPT
jgi:hypothetical protein